MRIYITVPTDDPRNAGRVFRELEEIGYDGGFSFESKHDPFLPLAIAAGTTRRLQLGTAVAIAFARNPMVLANIGYDLQVITGGRFVLGLGSQVRPHIEHRFSETWSKPVARMREMVLAIRAIWDAWEGHSKLDFSGEFYRHTIMIPAFNPGPNPYGSPRIFLGGFGPRMIELAGEVANGFLAHPFNTRTSLERIAIPALERGLARSGRPRDDFEIVCVTMVVTWTTEQEYESARASLQEQLAFYGSTPAYKSVLECHGWDDLHPELNRLSKQGRWAEMSELITDEMMEAIAVMRPRHEVASALLERLAGIADAVSLVNNRHPDPGNFRDIVADLRGQRATSSPRRPAVTGS
ncbi:MAG TPA: TIGR03617 family F420-dependent LLM class oxidoreductase [Candidatus Binatia bacterium]